MSISSTVANILADKLLSRDPRNQFMIGHGWENSAGETDHRFVEEAPALNCLQLVDILSSDERITEYLKNWCPYNRRPILNEGILISSNCWTQTTAVRDGRRRVNNIMGERSAQRLIQLWRGSVNVLELLADGSTLEVQTCEPANPESVQWLHSFLSSLKEERGRERTFVLLVEDVSAWIISLLGTFLDIEPSVFSKHISSGARASTPISARQGEKTTIVEGIMPVHIRSPQYLKHLDLQSKIEAMSVLEETGIGLHKQSWNAPTKDERTAENLLSSFTKFLQSNSFCRLDMGQNVARPIRFIGETNTSSSYDVDGDYARHRDTYDYFLESKITLHTTHLENNCGMVLTCHL